MIESRDDIVLLRRVGDGDRAALRQLYEQHSGALFHFIRSRLRDPFEASDVLQEVFIEVWRAAARFEGRSAARTWIFGIARHKAVDRMRHNSRLVVAEPDTSEPDDAPDPEAIVAAASDAARVRECISRLSEAHRSAIHLAFYAELRYDEIAAIEAVPTGTIKSRILHAKRLLMHCLSSFGIA